MVQPLGPSHHKRLSPSLVCGIREQPGGSQDYRETQPEPELQQPGGEEAREHVPSLALPTLPLAAPVPLKVSLRGRRPGQRRVESGSGRPKETVLHKSCEAEAQPWA